MKITVTNDELLDDKIYFKDDENNLVAIIRNMMPVYGIKFCTYDKNDKCIFIIDRLRDSETLLNGFLVSTTSKEIARIDYKSSFFGKTYSFSSELGELSVQNNSAVNNIQLTIDGNLVLYVQPTQIDNKKGCDINIVDMDNAEILLIIAFIIIVLAKD